MNFSQPADHVGRSSQTFFFSLFIFWPDISKPPAVRKLPIIFHKIHFIKSINYKQKSVIFHATF